jgi:hypothetical protein
MCYSNVGYSLGSSVCSDLGHVYIVSDHFASDAKTIPDRASVSISATNRWCGGSLFEVVRGVSDWFLQRSHCNVNTNRSNFRFNA